MRERDRLRTVLWLIATGAPWLVTACGCPRATHTTIGTYSTASLPRGNYALHGCEPSRSRHHEVSCRYEHDANRLHAVIEIVPCATVCGDVRATCSAVGHEVTCRKIDGNEVRVTMPFRLEHPEQFIGACGERGSTTPYPCRYVDRRDPRRVVHLESLAGFGPAFRDGEDSYGCSVDATANQVTCWHARYVNCAAGRRPAGTVVTRGELAEMIALEAASVPAFETLARELEVHNAPADLVAAARRAMADELRHAALVAALAGAPAAGITVALHEPRTLGEICADNRREGCTGEALAAIAAHALASRADGAERAVLATIARDEARHALLAFAIDDWIRATGCRS